MTSLRKAIALLMLLVLAPTLGLAGLLRVCLHEGSQKIEVVHFTAHDHGDDHGNQIIAVANHPGQQHAGQLHSGHRHDGGKVHESTKSHESVKGAHCEDIAVFSSIARTSPSSAESDAAPDSKVSPILTAAAQVPRLVFTSAEKLSVWPRAHNVRHARTISNLETVILII